MRNLKALITILACCVSTNLLAQKADSLNVPDDFRSPIGQFRSGAGVPVDTLDMPDGRVSIILKDDHSWEYVKNLAVVAQDSTFVADWDINNVHGYADFSLTSMPESVKLHLVDSVSRFVCPYQRAVYSKFGWRRRRKHLGCDLPLKVGEPVAAAFDGRVRIAKFVSGYGNLIVIRHENGLETYYGHLSKLGRKAGDWVHAGDIVGLGGSTGRSTGPHLHFETRYKGQPFDPEWLIDFENALLRSDEFLLKKSYLNASVRYSEAALKKSQEEANISSAAVESGEKNAEQSDVEAKAQELVQAISQSDVREKTVAPQTKTKEVKKLVGGTFHTLVSGETVGAISRQYGIPLAEIQKLNPEVNLDKVYAGQKIRISMEEKKPAATSASAAPAPAKTDASDAKPAATPAKSAVSTRNDIPASSPAVYHTVKKGDTISAISRKYGVAVSDIQRLNPGLDLDRISLDQKIRVK